jgi:hypothetical protein
MDEEPPGPSSITFSFNDYCVFLLRENSIQYTSLRKDIAVKGGYN